MKTSKRLQLFISSISMACIVWISKIWNGENLFRKLIFILVFLIINVFLVATSETPQKGDRSNGQ